MDFTNWNDLVEFQLFSHRGRMEKQLWILSNQKKSSTSFSFIRRFAMFHLQ